MKILVLGAGAIGSVFGGFLARAGHPVTLLGRKPHIEAIKKTGLWIEGIWGDHTIENLKGYVSLRDLKEKEQGSFDVALLSVKSYDTETMLSELTSCYPEPPPVVALQNGLGNLEKIEAWLGKEKTIGGRVIFGVEFLEPGRVKVTVAADNTVIGDLSGSPENTFVKSLAAAFNRASIPTEVTGEIKRYIWGKVLYNCALNGLATLIDVNYGALLSFAGTRTIMQTIIEEIFSVTRARNIPLEWQTPGEYSALLFEHLIPLTFDHHPSMLQDIKKGKRTEIDALNGAIVAMGNELGMDLPCNWLVTRLIKAKEAQIH